MVFEASGVDEAADGVAGQVAQAQGDAARCSRRPLTAWRGAVEVGQDVLAAAGQGPGQCLDLLQPVWDSLFQGVDEPLHQVLSQVGPRRGRPGSGAGRHPRRPGPQRGDHQRTGSRDTRSGCR